MISQSQRRPQAELEFHVDPRHFSDGVRVGVADAGVHLDAVDVCR